MKVTVTTLVENTVGSSLDLIAEYGLSFFIEIENHRILFDTGLGFALVNNSKPLNIDLSTVDSVVLSHGHIDHAGGLVQLIAQNQTFTLYAHPGVFDNKLLKNDEVSDVSVTHSEKYVAVGVADDRVVIENSGIELQLSNEPVELFPGVMTTGCIPMRTHFEEIESIFFVGEKGHELPDLIEDDMALIIDSDKGTIVVLGCTHRGIVNTLNHVVALTANKKIHAVMGGLHLLHADSNKLDTIIAQLQQFNIDKLVVGHCTGFDAIHRLRDAFGDGLVLNKVGLRQEF